jgi:A/G-specific adenine glycosylase
LLGSTIAFRRKLLTWYAAHRRDLPWRITGDQIADPYHVLLSEVMAQQTQVATVIPYYHRFLERFPTLASLADADEQVLLRLWQGLGYYSRARNLRAAARRVMSDFAGDIPQTVDELQTLPGVGRYTAGAIASIAFGQRAPVLDGNVIRVLCRLDKIKTDPRQPKTLAALWNRAEEILPRRHVGDFNSAMMELGALICTPRSPKCDRCPVRAHCQAKAANEQDRIPLVRKRKPNPVERRWTFCIEAQGKWLIERRPAKGRWAGMWQFVTVTLEEGEPTAKDVQRATGAKVSRPKHLGQITHTLTHRRYEFEAYRCAAIAASPQADGRAWVTPADLNVYPLPRPHVLIAAMLGD